MKFTWEMRYEIKVVDNGFVVKKVSDQDDEERIFHDYEEVVAWLQVDEHMARKS